MYSPDTNFLNHRPKTQKEGEGVVGKVRNVLRRSVENFRQAAGNNPRAGEKAKKRWGDWKNVTYIKDFLTAPRGYNSEKEIEAGQNLSGSEYAMKKQLRNSEHRQDYYEKMQDELRDFVLEVIFDPSDPAWDKLEATLSRGGDNQAYEGLKSNLDQVLFESGLSKNPTLLAENFDRWFETTFATPPEGDEEDSLFKLYQNSKNPANQLNLVLDGQFSFVNFLKNNQPENTTSGENAFNVSPEVEKNEEENPASTMAEMEQKNLNLQNQLDGLEKRKDKIEDETVYLVQTLKNQKTALETMNPVYDTEELNKITDSFLAKINQDLEARTVEGIKKVCTELSKSFAEAGLSQAQAEAKLGEFLGGLQLNYKEEVVGQSTSRYEKLLSEFSEEDILNWSDQITVSGKSYTYDEAVARLEALDKNREFKGMDSYLSFNDVTELKEFIQKQEVKNAYLKIKGENQEILSKEKKIIEEMFEFGLLDRNLRVADLAIIKKGLNALEQKTEEIKSKDFNLEQEFVNFYGKRSTWGPSIEFEFGIEKKSLELELKDLQTKIEALGIFKNYRDLVESNNFSSEAFVTKLKEELGQGKTEQVLDLEAPQKLTLKAIDSEPQVDLTTPTPEVAPNIKEFNAVKVLEAQTLEAGKPIKFNFTGSNQRINLACYKITEGGQNELQFLESVELFKDGLQHYSGITNSWQRMQSMGDAEKGLKYEVDNDSVIVSTNFNAPSYTFVFQYQDSKLPEAQAENTQTVVVEQLESGVSENQSQDVEQEPVADNTIAQSPETKIQAPEQSPVEENEVTNLDSAIDYLDTKSAVTFSDKKNYAEIPENGLLIGGNGNNILVHTVKEGEIIQVQFTSNSKENIAVQFRFEKGGNGQYTLMERNSQDEAWKPYVYAQNVAKQKGPNAFKGISHPNFDVFIQPDGRTLEVSRHVSGLFSAFNHNKLAVFSIAGSKETAESAKPADIEATESLGTQLPPQTQDKPVVLTEVTTENAPEVLKGAGSIGERV
jgi:tRNA-dihydrouridine synthase